MAAAAASPATLLLSVLALLLVALLSLPCCRAQPFAPQPVIKQLSSSGCDGGSDGSLYNCSVNAVVTVSGSNFCVLLSNSGWNGTCTLQLANFTYSGNFARSNSSSPGIDTLLFFSPSFFMGVGVGPTFWQSNALQRQGRYPLSLYWSNVTRLDPPSPLGINFLYSPQVVGLSGCGQDVNASSGVTNSVGCVNGLSNLTVTTSTPLTLGINYTVTLYGVNQQGVVNELHGTTAVAQASSPHSLTFRLPFVAWNSFTQYASYGLRLILDAANTAPLPLSFMQATAVWANLSTPQFLSLSSNACMTAAPTDVNGTLLVQALTACGSKAAFYILGQRLEQGYDIYSYGVPMTCQYVNSTAYYCVTSGNPSNSAAPAALIVRRSYQELPFFPPLTVATYGPLSLSCVTGSCPVSVNCTVSGCSPGDVVTVIGTGWDRLLKSATFSIPGLELPLTQQLIGYNNYTTREISFVLPSWYALRYTPDYAYSLTMEFSSQKSTLQAALSFSDPPPPVLYSVSGCSVQVGNGTTNCSLPSLGAPVVLTLTGENLYWQNLLVYIGGVYCPGDLFWNQQHYADQPAAQLRVKCYQAAYLTDAWSSLALMYVDTPFSVVVLPEAVMFVSPPSNSTAGSPTTTINTTNLNLLFLLFLLVIPLVIVLVAFLYFRHTQPYRAALVMLARLRAAQNRAEAAKRDTSHSPRDGNFEMAAPAHAYEPPVSAEAKRHSGEGKHHSGSDELHNDPSAIVLDDSARPLNYDQLDSDSMAGVQASRMEPLV